MSKKKILVICGIMILLLGMGFAAGRADLKINGHAKMDNMKWKIHFIDLDERNTNTITATTPAAIDPNDDTKITFAILPIEGDHVDCKDAIFQALGIGLSILTWGVSIGATIGFVITAYQYITAGSNVAQVQKAKMRMVQIVIGIVFYATFWGVMNWLLPGGLFGDGSI